MIARAGFDPDGHSGKALVNVLENYPRDELFQIDEDTLYRFALAILQLDERPRVRVLPRYDRFDRFVSVLVYVPRDRYDSADTRRGSATISPAPINGRVRAFYPFFPEGPLVRVHFIIARDDGATPKVDRATLESRRRGDRAQLDGRHRAKRSPPRTSRAQARALLERYRDAFPIDYREVYPPATAVADIGVDRGAVGGTPARRRVLSRSRDGAFLRRSEGLQREPADSAVRARAGAGKHGVQRRRRAHLPDPAAGRGGCLVP